MRKYFCWNLHSSLIFMVTCVKLEIAALVNLVVIDKFTEKKFFRIYLKKYKSMNK
jgi:hypothetical protein